MPISTATPSYKSCFVEYVPGIGGVVLQQLKTFKEFSVTKLVDVSLQK